MTRAKKDDKEQSKRFIEKAEEVADDDAGDKFERAFKVIVPPKSDTKQNSD